MKFLHGVSLRRSFAVGVAALFMGLLLYRPGETKEVEPAFQPLAVSTARAAMVERSTGLRLTGTVEGLTSAIISSRYSGQVEEVNVENGQRVYAGQPLFRTDSRELENNLRIAENGVRKARVNFDNIDTNYQRNQKLFEIGAVSQQSMETNVTQREVSLADVADAEENYDSGGSIRELDGALRHNGGPASGLYRGASGASPVRKQFQHDFRHRHPAPYGTCDEECHPAHRLCQAAYGKGRILRRSTGGGWQGTFPSNPDDDIGHDVWHDSHRVGYRSGGGGKSSHGSCNPGRPCDINASDSRGDTLLVFFAA
ncbi:MAG TPA: hypothetical protein DEP57_07590 [Selenomonas sp.]|nr:hypothetical protein [Selenomonas sp.]